jgi:hypothetical protein
VSYIVGGVTLPVAPYSISRSRGVKRSDFEVDGNSDIVVVKGKRVRVLTVSGCIYVAGQTKAQLETSYIFPLEALEGTEVLLAFPDTRHDGYWGFDSFSYSEVGGEGTLVRYQYSMTFVQGSNYLSL